MNHDAQEAAFGLLGLSPTNILPQQLVPLKRKQSALSEDVSTESINCICGFTYDDGFSIACDDCSRWCHAACFDIIEGEVPEEWRCWECVPRAVDRERAIKLQKTRQKQAEDRVEHRRRPSPGVERKHRRVSAAIDGGGNSKRKRRLSVIQPNEDEHVDIDEPWTHSYVHITQDIVPHQDTRDKLRRQAQHWRGVTALSPSSPYQSTPVRLPPDEPVPLTTVNPLPTSSYAHPTLSLFTNPSVRPPSYTVHTTTPIPSAHLITPYTSTITPTSTYLSDPLNAYAHLGMPKPFVHLMGPPLDLTLDSRITGDKGRFVRSGCRPNAVLRPIICSRPPQDKPKLESLSFGVFALRDLKANEEVVLGWEWDDGNAVHSLPALIESPHMFPAFSHCDDSPDHVRHLRNQMSNILHALSSTFTTCACGSRAKDCALTQMATFVDAETLLNSSSPVPPAHVDLGPLVGARRGFKTRERVPWSGGMSGVEMCADEGSASVSPPSLRTKKGRSKGRDKGKGKVRDIGDEGSTVLPNLSRRHQITIKTSASPRSSSADHAGPMNVELDAEKHEDKMPPKMRKKWIHRESEALKELNDRSSESPMGSVVSLGSPGDAMGVGIKMDELDDHHQMPPPPMPAALDPTTISSVDLLPQRSRSPLDSHTTTSPSSSFAKLSLLSPIVSPPASNVIPATPPDGIAEPWAWGSLQRVEVVSPPETASDVKSSNLHPSSESKSSSAVVEPSTPLAHDDNHSQTSPRVEPASHDLPAPHSPTPSTIPIPSLPVSTTTPALEPPTEPPPPPPPHPPIAPLRSSSDSPLLAQSSTPDLSLSSSDPTSQPLHAPQSQLQPQTLSPPPPPPASEACSEEQQQQADVQVPDPPAPAPPPPPPPSPPPQPKVKMSLRDFALRKKKQREEEMAKASPVGGHMALGAEREAGGHVGGGGHSDGVVDGAHEGGGGGQGGHDVGGTAQESGPAQMNSAERAEGHRVQAEEDTVHMIKVEKGTADKTKAATPEKSEGDKAENVEVTMQAKENSPETIHLTGAESSRMDVETAPVEILDAHPNGDVVMADEHDPDDTDDQVSIPESLDEPSTAAAITNGAVSPIQPQTYSPLHPLPPNRIASPNASRTAKLELLEHPIPNGLVAADPNEDSHPLPPAASLRPINGTSIHSNDPTPGRSSITPPASNFRAHSRRPSQEDGEIPSNNGDSPPPPKSRFAPRNPALPPRSHTPPKQPRSFQASPPASTPSISALNNRRPSLPPYRSPAPSQFHGASAPGSRPLPSGPRALRAGNHLSHVPPPGYTSSRSLSGPQYLPRGPSADRDRVDWDRDRSWQPSPARSRWAGGSGWSR